MRRAVWPLVISAVAVAAMFTLVFPTRTYFAQRAQVARVQHQVDTLAASNRALSRQAAALNTNADIERIARQDYGLVRPGEEAYAILPAPASSSHGHGSASSAGSSGSRASGGKASTAGTDATSGSLWSRLEAELTFWR